METSDRTKIPGWGADLQPEQRPGVPMEQPARVENVVTVLPRQPAVERVLRGASVPEMPPVFGTTVPPRGLSGVMRRAAYRIPDHRPSHWLLLMLADRVDVAEGLVEDLGRTRLLAIGGGVLGLGIVGWFLSRRR